MRIGAMKKQSQNKANSNPNKAMKAMISGELFDLVLLGFGLGTYTFYW
jgi:hypothetical protein